MSFNDLFARQLAQRRIVEAIAEEAKEVLAETPAPAEETAEERAAREERERKLQEAQERALAAFTANRPHVQIDVDLDDPEEREALNRAVDALPVDEDPDHATTSDDLGLGSADDVDALPVDDSSGGETDPEPTDAELEAAIAEAQALEAEKIPATERLTEAQCTQTSAPPKSNSSSSYSPTSSTGKLKLSAKQRKEQARAQKSGAGRKSGRG